jgi:hypothetical protein
MRTGIGKRTEISLLHAISQNFVTMHHVFAIKHCPKLGNFYSARQTLLSFVQKEKKKLKIKTKIA